MNIALLVTLFTVLVCIATAVLDRKRVPIPVSPAARFEFRGGPRDHHRPSRPNAGWPARFERLHSWGLFAAVSLAVNAAAGITASSRSDRRGRA